MEMLTFPPRHAKCTYSFFSLAIKNTEDGPTKKDPASSDLLCDGEQWVLSRLEGVLGERKKLIVTFFLWTVLGLRWKKSEVGPKVLIN